MQYQLEHGTQHKHLLARKMFITSHARENKIQGVCTWNPSVDLYERVYERCQALRMQAWKMLWEMLKTVYYLKVKP